MLNSVSLISPTFLTSWFHSFHLIVQVQLLFMFQPFNLSLTAKSDHCSKGVCKLAALLVV